MLGWMIYLHRQADDPRRPATPSSPKGALVAAWQGRLHARDWLKDLVWSGSAFDLGGNYGYPDWMTARAGAVIPVVRDGPPHANETWIVGEGDVVDPGWVGRTIFNAEVAEQCHDDEWLLIQIWDES